jgi:hypothetical protein
MMVAGICFEMILSKMVGPSVSARLPGQEHGREKGGGGQGTQQQVKWTYAQLLQGTVMDTATVYNTPHLRTAAWSAATAWRLFSQHGGKCGFYLAAAWAACSSEAIVRTEPRVGQYRVPTTGGAQDALTPRSRLQQVEALSCVRRIIAVRYSAAAGRASQLFACIP